MAVSQWCPGRTRTLENISHSVIGYSVMLCFFYILSALGAVTAYQHFQQTIPNGENVVNPCDLDGVRGQPWPGVGHRQTAGSGTRNPFGNDWATNGGVSTTRAEQMRQNVLGVGHASIIHSLVIKHPRVTGNAPANDSFILFLEWKYFFSDQQVWDSCICNQDSDGDGKTNGEELGDPKCIWTPGQAPARTTSISHPGTNPTQYLLLLYMHVLCGSESIDCEYSIAFD